MKLVAGLAIAVLGFGVARAARTSIVNTRDDAMEAEAPYAPSARAAPFLALGYREAAADLLYVRMRGYLGEYYGTTGSGLIGLGEAIVALDPKFRRVYEIAANATTMAERGLDQAALKRAVELLEQGLRHFPDDWALPYLAGQIYIQDLKTDDPAQRRAWDERGTLLVESALRKPGAPIQAVQWAAFLRTKLGQRQRAIESMRELVLLTSGPARTKVLENLQKLTDEDDGLLGEVLEMRTKFEQAWRRNRPFVNATTYVLIGPRLQPGFDMTDLATGGHDIVGSAETEESVEPL